MKKKNLFALLLALCLSLSLAACGSSASPTTAPTDEPSTQATPEATPESTPEPVEETTASVETYSLGLLKGPTGMGGVYVIDGAENDLYIESDNCDCDYDITLAAAPTDLSTLLINGEMDIAAIATNLAATLYNKTEGGIQIIALNTKGVLYILENGESVQSVTDLKGKTIYATGQGANPEYVLNYILTSNGLTPGTDVTIEWRDSEELSTLMASGEIDLCMLPVPAATAVLMKNENVRSALDLTKEWEALGNGSELIMGCIVARTQFIEENPEAVEAFLAQYEDSSSRVLSDDNAAALMAQYEIVGSEGIAKAAIPNANLCFIKGSDMQSAITGYFDVLFAADPTSIGGSLPGDDFFYESN